MKRPIFYADYTTKSLTARHSRGSPAAIFTAVRGVANPATYYDENGVIQVVTDSDVPRFGYGYWDLTGWHKCSDNLPELIIEGQNTNYITDSMFGRAIGADDWNSFWGTITDSATSLINITGAKERNIIYTFLGTEGNWQSALHQFTADDSFDTSGDDIRFTLSFWARGDLSGITSGLGDNKFCQVDLQENDETYIDSPIVIRLNHASVANLHPTEWRKFTYSGNATGAAGRRLWFYFIGLSNINKPLAGENFDITITQVDIIKHPHATSPIPTTTAVLTRNAETLKYEIAGNRNAAVESCVVKFSSEQTTATVIDVYLLDTDTVRRFMKFDSWQDGWSFRPNQDEVDCSAEDVLLTTVNTEYTFGSVCQHSSPYAEIYVDGISTATEVTTDFPDPGWGTYFWVGSDQWSLKQLNGGIKKIAFFDQAVGAGDMADLHNYDDWDWLFGTKDVQGFAQQATMGQKIITLKEDINK